MAKRLCVECQTKKKATRPAVKLADTSKTVEYVCPECWAKLDYAVYLK